MRRTPVKRQQRHVAGHSLGSGGACNVLSLILPAARDVWNGLQPLEVNYPPRGGERLAAIAIVVLTMPDTLSVARRWQFCSRCGQPMFEYYACPDGHYGLAGEALHTAPLHTIACPVCHAAYHLLDRLDGSGWPVARIHHGAAQHPASLHAPARGKNPSRQPEGHAPGRRTA